MRVKHVQHRNIQIYFCNIRMEHLQHYSRIFETCEIYACNMRQTLAKTEGSSLPAGSSRHRRGGGLGCGLVRAAPELWRMPSLPPRSSLGAAACPPMCGSLWVGRLSEIRKTRTHTRKIRTQKTRTLIRISTHGT